MGSMACCSRIQPETQNTTPKLQKIPSHVAEDNINNPCGSNDDSNSDPILVKNKSRQRRRSSKSIKMNCTTFYSNLYQTAINSNEDNSNIIMSPYSILIAMTMCMVGAQGKTLKEILQVLYPDANVGNDNNNNDSDNAQDVNFENAKNITHKMMHTCKSLNNQYSEDNSDLGVIIHIANKIYIDHSFQILPSYINSIDVDAIKSVNLKNVNKTVKMINSWCCQQTNGQIKQIVTSDNISRCKLVIVNVVYFSGKFLNPFKIQKTEDDIPFYTDYKRQEEVCKLSMMHSDEDDHYFAQNVNGIFDVVKLNFGNSKLSLILAIHNGSNNDHSDDNKVAYTVKDLVKINKNDDWEYRNLYLYVPKFKYDHLTEASPILEQMGIRNAFHDTADFSAMSGGADLCIDKVIHKAMIEIDEKGAKASAITADIMQGKGIRYSDAEEQITPTIRFDHPFDFIIYDNKRKINIFNGRFNGR